MSIMAATVFFSLFIRGRFKACTGLLMSSELGVRASGSEPSGDRRRGGSTIRMHRAKRGAALCRRLAATAGILYLLLIGSNSPVEIGEQGLDK